MVDETGILGINRRPTVDKPQKLFLHGIFCILRGSKVEGDNEERKEKITTIKLIRENKKIKNKLPKHYLKHRRN